MLDGRYNGKPARWLLLGLQEFCDFVGCGHGGLGAVAGYGDGGYCGSVASGFEGLLAVKQADCEASVEGVACGRGVNCFYCEGWNHFADAIGRGDERALRAHFNCDIFGAALEEEIGAAG